MLFSSQITPKTELRASIHQHYRCDEPKLVEALLPLASLESQAQARVQSQAMGLTKNAREAAQTGSGIQNLLNEYALSTQEGVVLMCLAEALLRVPDSTTADRLIRDKLISGDWSAHIGNSDSLFVNSSAWGLFVSGRVVSFNDDEKSKHINRLKKTIGKIGEPIIRKAMRQAMEIMGTQFVLGRTIEEANKKALKEEAKGYRYSYDMLGEAARTMHDADQYFESYAHAIARIGEAAKGKGIYKGAGISVKLSAIHPRYEFAQRDRVMSELVPRLKSLALLAKEHNIGLSVDAEEADRLEMSLDIIEAVYADADLDGWEGFGVVVQAYQKRALPTLNWLIDLSQKVGRKMMLRLVKGAYWDSEIKLAQVEGLPSYPVFTRKASTDVSYQACAALLLDNREFIYPQFASHNAYTVAYVLERAEGNFEGFEFQRLHGMGEGLYDSLLQDQQLPVRIYAPVGEHESLLAYLVRRLLENGANTSFVNNIVDDKIPLSSLVENPITKVKRWEHIGNPNIALPLELYGKERLNSKGIDLTHLPHLEKLQQAQAQEKARSSMPNLSSDVATIISSNPANKQDIIGALPKTDAKALKIKIENSRAAFQTWSKTDIETRALCLERLGDSLEEHRDELIALCTREAGKVSADGIAEVREAIDFCRFYANEGRKVFTPHNVWGVEGNLESRGIVVCISPWNFPLAIFLGQVTAALVAGNTVLAKPADSTCLIAARAIELIAECGFPDKVVQLVLMPGPELGKLLLPDERVAAVLFTGSTKVGANIANTLSARPGSRIPLIAETGGQNCMLVDSSALPEQVVDDVISSGFQSAGQRCSALRVLFLQEDVADKTIAMIIGAMRELHVGKPEFLRTDVGPVIDKNALNALENHVNYMQNKGKLLYQCALPPECEDGTFFAPRLYEISGIEILPEEVFGPVVHIVRYKATQLNEAIDAINSTGFGLSSGVHSRIETTCSLFAERIKAGNIYINRNTIGAVVGVQPFGGHGLSGTGPKAGGPAYVYRLSRGPNKVEQQTDQKALDNINFSKGKTLEQALHYLAQDNTGWSHLEVKERAIRVKLWIDTLSRDNMNTLPPTLTSQIDAMTCEAVSSQSGATTLTGPTGELNQLMMEARGTVLCLQQNDNNIIASIRQIAAALLSGNRVIHASSSLFEFDMGMQEAGIGQVYERVNLDSEKALQKILLAFELNAVAVCGPQGLAKLSDSILVSRPGALIPLIIETSGPTLMQRFVTEKVVSNDTTASGGNASLLAMGDGD